jgi:hypothetical protein
LTHCIVIECDEHSHDASYYSCENKRIMTIFRDLASRPLIVIRFNPDGYKKKKCFDFNDKNQIIVNESEWEMRSNALKEEINFHLTHIP